MRYVEGNRSKLQINNLPHPPYTFEIRYIKQKRRMGWKKLLFLALICMALFAMAGLPVMNGLLVFFIIFAATRQRGNRHLHPQRGPRAVLTEPGCIMTQRPDYQSGRTAPVSDNPEQIGNAIRNAGGIVNYINQP